MIEFKSSLLLIGFVALSGCSSILPDPAPADVIYRLSVQDDSVKAEPNAHVIRVDRPDGSRVFQGRDIVLSPDGRRLASAAQAQWVELTPIMLQESLIDQMSTSPSLIGVTPASGARTDTRVHFTIKNFEARFDRGEGAAPLVVVRYDVTYANAANRNLLGTLSIKKEQRAEESRVSAIVAAMETANRAAMTDIVAWLETQAQQGAS